MRNTLFQFLYYNIIKFVQKDGVGLTAYARLFKIQIILAQILGGFEAVVIGDSNIELLANYNTMKKFKKVTLNLGVGGSYCQSWLDFFNNDKVGKWVFKQIKTKKIIWNIGGNHILLNIMDIAEMGLKRIDDMFPHSYNCTVPPIKTEILNMLDDYLPEYRNRSKKMWGKDLRILNKYITTIWKDKVINLYDLFIVNKDIPIFKDAVHYSNYIIDNVLIPIFKKFI